VTSLQRRLLARVLAATLRKEWYRAQTSGERVTLASLYRRGLLERRVWREHARAKAAGEYSSPAHEYQAHEQFVSVWKEMQPLVT
jgi:S-adenosylmethionine:diacylglycerol 3-amino-3-carboxypropyl transferase